MKSKFYFRMLLVTVLLIVINSYGKSDYSFEPRNAAFFRLISSGVSDELVDGYSSQMQFLLEEKTGWTIMNHQATEQEVRNQGGDLFCSKVDCATLNGRYLNVDYVIFGTIQTVGKSRAITLQIANVSTGRIISDVSKFYGGRESSFVKKILPGIAEQAANDVHDIATSRMDLIAESKSSATKTVQKQAKGNTFNDMRGYLSYSDSSPVNSISTDGKMAFGYLMVGANLGGDDPLRYSYQLQSYLSLIGAHAMLYIDEMELLMQAKGGELRCRNRKQAVQIGRLLGVDFMGYGRFSRIGKLFFIRTRIVNVDSGERVQRSSKLYRGREDIFLTEVIPDIAEQIGDAYERSGEFSYSY